MAIPRNEDGLAIWMPVFAAGISTNASLYGIAIPDAATIQSAVDQFISARTIALNPATRNVGTIDEKDVKKASALGVCRLFYSDIQRNNGVSNDDKLLIGVTPLSTSRTRRNCPQTVPGLNAVAATQGAHTVEYFNSVDQTNRAKPFGATEIELFVAVADEVVSDPAEAKFYRKFTTNPMAVFFNAEDSGKRATYFARWAGIRGDTSPFSAGVSLPIAA
jgi:hypothetical protein